MSHTVTIATKVKDVSAVAAACRRLNLPQPAHGTARLYGGAATGLLVQLPGWQYPLVIDTTTGAIQYDNFNGDWGAPEHLDKFLQLYAVEKAKLEARRQNHRVVEQELPSGAVRLQIIESP